MKAKRILVFSLGIGAVLGAGCRPGQPTPIETPPNPVQVETTTVSLTTVPQTYEATGSVRARFNATLSSKVMARVVAVRANEGDAVSKGQVLVNLDAGELAAGVQVAEANLASSSVGVDNARIAREMEARTSAARIEQAQAAVLQSVAALSAARAKLDLALAGPRTQEKQQAHLGVVQAESALHLAKTQLDRVASLVSEGAMAKKNLDEAQSAYEVALARRDTAVQAERMADEGGRSEDVRTAREGVVQAQAAVKQAEANLSQAKAGALQAKVRAEEIRAASAQVNQSAAALRSARVSLSYASVAAPFDGRVVQRSVDTGAMATPGSPLLGIEGGDLRLEAIVPESVLAHLHRGTLVPVVVDALQRTFSGKVDEIVPKGDAASHTFVVKIVLPEAMGLHSGMFGRARITTGSMQAMLLPKDAVWQREGLAYAYVVNADGIARLRLVTVGDSEGDRVRVLSGLSPGETVVDSGRERIADGVKVASR